MAICKGWREAGMDTSPPRPQPSEKTKKEMQEGRIQSMRARYRAERGMLADFYSRKPPLYEHYIVTTPGGWNVPSKLLQNPEYVRWVDEFMVTEATRVEMQAGSKQVAIHDAKK